MATIAAASRSQRWKDTRQPGWWCARVHGPGFGVRAEVSTEDAMRGHPQRTHCRSRFGRVVDERGPAVGGEEHAQKNVGPSPTAESLGIPHGTDCGGWSAVTPGYAKAAATCAVVQGGRPPRTIERSAAKPQATIELRPKTVYGSGCPSKSIAPTGPVLSSSGGPYAATLSAPVEK